VNNFKYYISKMLQKTDLYLVFDRYKPYSTKSVTRLGRAVQTSRVHQLSDEVCNKKLSYRSETALQGAL